MIELLELLLTTLGSVFRSRKRLILENLLLRQQLQVAIRCQRRPQSRSRGRRPSARTQARMAWTASAYG